MKVRRKKTGNRIVWLWLSVVAVAGLAIACSLIGGHPPSPNSCKTIEPSPQRGEGRGEGATKPSSIIASPTLKSLIINPNSTSGYLDFIIDTGAKRGLSHFLPEDTCSKNRDCPLFHTASTLINYFFIGITLPSKEFWVNLNPTQPKRITNSYLEQTDIGKVLLEQDLKLKQDASILQDPRTKVGKRYWQLIDNSLKEQALNNTDITPNTRVWIIPDEAIVYEHNNTYTIVKATLKVLLEQEYLVQNIPSPQRGEGWGEGGTLPRLEKGQVPEQLGKRSIIQHAMHQTILPVLNHKVNHHPDYAPLRQVYHSLILAECFKQRYRSQRAEVRSQKKQTNPYAQYINSSYLEGLTSKEPWDTQDIYQAYLKSHKRGEYNYYRTEYDQFQLNLVQKHYWAGGVRLSPINKVLRRISSAFRIQSPALVDSFDGEAESRFVRKIRKYPYIDEEGIKIIESKIFRMSWDNYRNLNILDLMSGRITHVPFEGTNIIGVGLNEEELKANKRLTGYKVQDLNKEPRLPFEENYFGCITVVAGMAYLKNPKELFSQGAKVLKPGGILFIAFTDDYSEDEAEESWKLMDRVRRVEFTKASIENSGAFENIQHDPYAYRDLYLSEMPLDIITAYKKGNAPIPPTNLKPPPPGASGDETAEQLVRDALDDQLAPLHTQCKMDPGYIRSILDYLNSPEFSTEFPNGKPTFFANALLYWAGLDEEERARFPFWPKWGPAEDLGKNGVTFGPGVLRQIILTRPHIQMVLRIIQTLLARGDISPIHIARELAGIAVSDLGRRFAGDTEKRVAQVCREVIRRLAKEGYGEIEHEFKAISTQALWYLSLEIRNLWHDHFNTIRQCLLFFKALKENSDISEQLRHECNVLHSALLPIENSFSNVHWMVLQPSFLEDAKCEQLVQDLEEIYYRAKEISIIIRWRGFEKSLGEKGELQKIREALSKFNTDMKILLDSIKCPIKLETVNLNEAIKEGGHKCGLNLLDLADFEYNLTWNLQLSDDERIKNFPTYYKSLFVYLFTNLFYNSIVHAFPGEVTPRGSRIDASSSIEGNRVLIAISDNGRGMPEEACKIVEAATGKQQVFTRHYSRFYSETASWHGSGLALCWDIVTTHDGTISAKSELGKGTTFFITLPIEDEGPPAGGPRIVYRCNLAIDLDTLKIEGMNPEEIKRTDRIYEALRVNPTGLPDTPPDTASDRDTAGIDLSEIILKPGKRGFVIE